MGECLSNSRRQDLKELPALQQEFLQASILFCHFHVIKHLFKLIVELDAVT